MGSKRTNLIGCLNGTGITSTNYKENMFQYSSTTKIDKKWFLTKHGELLDLNQISYVRIEEDDDGVSDDPSEIRFIVKANCFDILAVCESAQEAKDYIKEIYNFLIAE